MKTAENPRMNNPLSSAAEARARGSVGAPRAGPGAATGRRRTTGMPAPAATRKATGTRSAPPQTPSSIRGSRSRPPAAPSEVQITPSFLKFLAIDFAARVALGKNFARGAVAASTRPGVEQPLDDQRDDEDQHPPPQRHRREAEHPAGSRPPAHVFEVHPHCRSSLLDALERDATQVRARTLDSRQLAAGLAG